MIETRNLHKSFFKGEVETKVLRGIDFKAKDGEFVAIMGRSGAGKSTLMYQMSLLDYATKGEVLIDGTLAETINDKKRVSFRLFNFGYVFQEYALLPELTAIENVVLPLLMQGKRNGDARGEAEEALAKVGLDHRLENLPSQLSGGEQQRVAIARSVAHGPKVLFADEPTANLDSESAGAVMKIFDDLHAEGQTIIMVTHEREYALHAERIVFIDDGLVTKEEKISKRASK